MNQGNIKILFLDSLNEEKSIFRTTLLQAYKNEIVYEDNIDKAFTNFSKEAKSFHLLILSGSKENISSLELVKKFSKINSNIKIVVINKFENKESIFKAVESGVNRVLLYPKTEENDKINLDVVIDYIEQIKKLNNLNLNAQNCKKVVNEYKKAVDASTIFSISDLGGRITYANKQFVNVSGYSLDELRKKSHSIVRHPDMDKEVFKELWKTINNKEIWRGVLKNISKDGRAYYVDATIVPILDENQNILEFAGIRHDITELITKTKELEELKNKQRAKDIEKALQIKILDILEFIPFATVFVDDNSSKIIAYNTDFSLLFSKHPCIKANEPTLKDFFESRDDYLYLNDDFTFFDTYELCDEDNRVAIVKLNSQEKEFLIGATKKDNGTIITIVEIK